MWTDLIIEKDYTKAIRRSLIEAKKTAEERKKRVDDFAKTVKPVFDEYGLSFEVNSKDGFTILGGKSVVVFYPFGSPITAFYKEEDKRFRRMYKLSKWTDAIDMSMEDCPEYLKIPGSKRKSNYNAEKRFLLKIRPNCFWCNIPLNDGTATIDHYYPLSKGGGNRIENLVLSCKECNGKKSDRIPDLNSEKEELRRIIRRKIAESYMFKSVQLIARKR